jgi:hypothetical protein
LDVPSEEVSKSTEGNDQGDIIETKLSVLLEEVRALLRTHQKITAVAPSSKS